MLKQMRKRIKYLVAGLVCAMILGLGSQSPLILKATSATLTFSAESRSVTVGDTFSVVIILDSNEKIGGFEGYVSYDANIVEFVTGGSFVNGGDGLLRINDVDSADVEKTKKYALEFKAKKTGDCTFDTSDAPAVYNENGDELSVSSNKLTISVKDSQSLSSNNKLSKLLISPGELNQSYDNDITAYKVEIPYESDMLFISAVPKDDNAVVTVEGNENLKVGKNYVHVIVTAPSGAKKDIQIEVTRQAEGSSQDKTQEEVQTGVTLSTDEDNNVVLTDIHTYQVAKLEDESSIPAGYEKSSINIDGEKLDAYVLSDDLKSEFLLLYLTNDKGETGFYQYDRIEKTIQRFEQSSISNKPADDILGLDSDENEAVSPATIITGVLAVIIIILTIALAVVIMKNKNAKYK